MLAISRGIRPEILTRIRFVVRSNKYSRLLTTSIFRNSSITSLISPPRSWSTENKSQINSRIFSSLIKLKSFSTYNGAGPQKQLRPDEYTEKAWNIITKLPEYSDRYQAQHIEAPLILKALLDEGRGELTHRILSKVNTDVGTIERLLHIFVLPTKY